MIESKTYDIFEDMSQRIRCEYISDLRYKKHAIMLELCTMNLSKYSQEQLEDFSYYVFGIDYQSLKKKIK